MARPVGWVAVLLLLAATACAGKAPSAPGSAPAAPAPTPADVAPGPPAAEVAPEGAPGGPVGALPLRRYVEVFRRPGAARPAFVLDGLNPTGDLVPMLVEERAADGWVEVLLPLKPNGTTGWIRTRDVRLVEQRHRIVVDLSGRILRHFVDGALRHRFRVGVGRPDTPTPTGRFYVWVRVPQRNPYGPYGALALGLSGFSEVLDDWPGGGRLAIHGTPDPSDPGRRVSAGCVRLRNGDLRALWDVPLGTVVVIRP